MNERKLEFISKTITDIGKAIVIASIISNFFKEMPVDMAFLIISFGLLLIFIGFIIYPAGGEK